MNKTEKQKLKQLMLQKIDKIKNNIQAFGDLSKPVAPDNAIGRITRMEAINSRSINQASLAKSKQTLRQLEKSIAKIDHPDFGNCQNCEEPIPIKRLLIMPETILCVACAQGIE